MSAPEPRRILFLNRSYWPDAEATGQLLTELCEDLAEDFSVTVLAGQPNQNPRGDLFIENGREERCGVIIERVLNTQFAKRSLFGKLLNFLSYLWSAFRRLGRIHNVDVVVCETDPFLLPFLAVWLRRRTGCKLVFYLQDIYPDIAVALGKAREGLIVRTIRKLLRWCYRQADAVVVLSDDMRDRMLSWQAISADKLHVVPNWVDTGDVYPVKSGNPWRNAHNPDDRFLVMYSGNLGLSQDLHLLIDAAEQLRDEPDLEFLIVGDGAQKLALMALAEEKALTNLRFLPYQPREQLAQSLSAADLHLLPIRADALACLMPSKLYGILASGTAVLSAAPTASELARLVEEERIGYNIDPYTPDGLSRKIRQILNDRQDAIDRGERARRLAEARFDRRESVQQFHELIDSLTRENVDIEAKQLVHA